MDSLRGLVGRHRAGVATGTVALALVALVVLRTAGRGDAAAPGPVVPVERRDFSASVAAIGAVKPEIGAEVRVGSRISGRVRRLRANIGDQVRRGQVIAELETEELDAVLAQREAELALATARLGALEALAPAEAAQAEAELARVTATARLAAADWDRQQSLLRQGLTTQAQAEEARERDLVAQSGQQSAQRALEMVRTGIEERRRQGQAEQARAQAARESARVARSFAVITAPIAGHVASVATQEGETVAAGLNAPTFVTIVDLARLQVHAFVDEVDIGQVRTAQRATFTVDAFPASDFEGEVAAIYPSATIQDNVVKYVVAIRITDAEAGLLRPEMTASVRILLAPRAVLAVPARAIRREAGRSVVYVWDGSRSTPRPVRVGWRDGPWVEIVDGLREGERILLDPAVPGSGGNGR